MASKRVIITDYLHAYFADWLRSAGFEVDERPDITNAALAEIIHLYHGIGLSTKILLNREMLDRAKQLEFIARAGSGMENIDVTYARSKGIHVVNSPEGNANAVGEHTLGLLLAVMNHIARSDREIRSGVWKREENRGVELLGRTVGIIGYGHTGRAFASKLKGLGVFVLAHDKYVTGFGDDFVEEVSKDQIRQEADIISFHLPLTPETHHYCDAAFLAGCRTGLWVLNASRGKIVDAAALLDALKSGKVSGAGLDVYENEQFYNLPEADQQIMDALATQNNTVLTPHVAGWSVESYLKLSKVLTEKLAAIGVSASM